MTLVPQDSLPADMIRAATHRRGRLELFDTLDARKTALVVIDMQNAWLASGGPFETPPARALIPRINRLASALRAKQGSVVWIQHTAGQAGEEGYWPLYFDNFIAPERRAAAIQALTPGSPMHDLHSELIVQQSDSMLPKYRFSAFLRTAHSLEAMLVARGIDTLIVTGTATNVCVESTARDAMMLDFRVFMPHDGTAALDLDAHLAGVRNVMQSFADVRPVESLLRLIEMTPR
jgi:ureidoacrylate peracid hydrolase